jgi:hypothetical protein
LKKHVLPILKRPLINDRRFVSVVDSSCCSIFETFGESVDVVILLPCPESVSDAKHKIYRIVENLKNQIDLATCFN